MARQSLKNIQRLIKEATNDVPVEVSFVSDLNAAIEKLNARDARKPSKSFKPSSMQCVRNMYFQLVGEEIDSDDRASADLVGIMESGTDRHLRIQAALTQMREMNIDCDYIDVETFIEQRGLKNLRVVSKNGFETKLFNEDLNMSFMCDGIIRYKGQYYVFEFKTETINKWFSRRGVDESHVPQGTCYSIAFKLDQVMFLYESRDTTSKKAYVLVVTDEMKYKVLSDIELVEGAASQGVPPRIPADIQKKTCAYCNYKSACSKAGT